MVPPGGETQSSRKDSVHWMSACKLPPAFSELLMNYLLLLLLELLLLPSN